MRQFLPLASFAPFAGDQILAILKSSAEVRWHRFRLYKKETKLTVTLSGPTLDFAASLRGTSEDAGHGKHAIWRHFATRRSGNEPSKVVELSQNWTTNTLRIQLDRYQPKNTDKQYYSWFDEGVEQHYQTPAYGIANLAVANSTIEKFLGQNFDGYIEAHLRNATVITQKTFHTAQEHKVGLLSSERSNGR